MLSEKVEMNSRLLGEHLCFWSWKECNKFAMCIVGKADSLCNFLAFSMKFFLKSVT